MFCNSSGRFHLIRCLVVPIIYSSFFVGLTDDLRAQAIKDKCFTIVHLPRSTGYSKDKLNQEIAAAKSKEDVRRLILLKNFPPSTIIIRIRQDSLITSWWTYNTGTKKEREDNNIFFRSKDNNSLRFYKLSDFKTIFKDTLVIIDSLNIELFIHDEQYVDTGFQLNYSCMKNKTVRVENIPYKKWSLIFSSQLFEGCIDDIYTITISHSYNPQRKLAACYLIFLSDDQKDALLDIAEFEYSMNPELNAKDIAAKVAGYAKNSIGSLYFPQLVDWLNSNLSNKPNGNSQ